MHPSLSHRTTFYLILAGILISLFVGVILVNTFDLSIQPKTRPSGVACTLEAQLCPDGSTVGRVPPMCEFAACPDGTIQDDNFTPDIGTVTVSTVPVQPGESEMAKIPDLPLGSTSAPASPFPVNYVIEHRSALNEKQVAVTGFVVMNNLKDQECPEGSMCTLMYTMPSIVLADSNSPRRDLNYDLRVNMSEEARVQADQYPVGKQVTVTGTVSGNLDGVLVMP